MEKAIALIIKGRVQGVGYRAATQKKGAQLGLSGWVRNLPDGSVEAFAQGTRPQLDALIAWCRQGPALAKVASVDTRPETADPTLKAFEIRRD